MCSHLGGTLVVYQRPQDTPLRDAQRGFRLGANGSADSASVLANHRPGEKAFALHPSKTATLVGALGKSPGSLHSWVRLVAQALLCILNNRILMGTGLVYYC